MQINNCVEQMMSVPTHKIKSKVVFCADHIVDEETARQAVIATNLVGLKMDGENTSIDSLDAVNVFFSENGDVSLSMDDGHLGNHMWLIIIHGSKVKEYEPIKILTIVTEELCHHFWNIRDEREVKYKVMEVLNQAYPLLEISDLYDMDTV